jgi:hypothetical protein
LGKTKHEKKEERRQRRSRMGGDTDGKKEKKKRRQGVQHLNLGCSILFESVEYIYKIFFLHFFKELKHFFKELRVFI